MIRPLLVEMETAVHIKNRTMWIGQLVNDATLFRLSLPFWLTVNSKITVIRTF